MKCEDCGEEFEGPKKLENHKRNHVFKLCKYCENGFPSLSLKHHIKTCSSNSEKTEFSCDQCDYKTTLRMNLVRHKKAKHVQKPVIEKTKPLIPCIYCGLVFDSKSKVKNHIKTHLVTKEPKEAKETLEGPKRTLVKGAMKLHMKIYHMDLP